MRYYLRDPEQNSITGPFDLDEIEAKLQAGELSAGTLATADIGGGLARILHASPEDWMPAESIPGLGEERQPSAEVLPPGPPPLPPQSVVNAHPSTSRGMVFCPACGHKLLPDVGSVCDHCGKELIVVGPQPAKPPESKPEGVLPTVFVGMGGCLSVVLLILGTILVLGFLLLLTVMSKCKA